MKNILVTGVLGFIGYHTVVKLLNSGHNVVGIDNINDYYNVRQKYDKLPLLGINEVSIWPHQCFESLIYPKFSFYKIDITDRYQIEMLFANHQFDIVINLAAQAGVQYSIQNPHSYIENNITGFVNLIDSSRNNNIDHFIYASSSSVYGNRDNVPFKETDAVDHPISLYAASKKANELIAHSYSHLYDLKTTGLRFFTVYGPWGRPDMAPFIFTRKIYKNEELIVFNDGNLLRDFTYVDDIVDGINLIVERKEISKETYAIYNIGNSQPINILDFIEVIEENLGLKAKIKFEAMREGDVFKTYASTEKLNKDYGYQPKVTIKEGVSLFVDWYKSYYKNV